MTAARLSVRRRLPRLWLDVADGGERSQARPRRRLVAPQVQASRRGKLRGAGLKSPEHLAGMRALIRANPSQGCLTGDLFEAYSLTSFIALCSPISPGHNQAKKPDQIASGRAFFFLLRAQPRRFSLEQLPVAPIGQSGISDTRQIAIAVGFATRGCVTRLRGRPVSMGFFWSDKTSQEDYTK